MKVNNFRLLEDERIDLSAREVFFVGRNSQGKSALLEALYYASYGSSFRTKKDSEVAKMGKDRAKHFAVSAMYDEKGISSRVDIVWNEKDGKRIEKNGKRIHDRKELISTVPCVLFCHGDMRFVMGTAEEKRFFLNQTAAMCDALYLDDLRSYNAVLKNRNALLRSMGEGLSVDMATLDALDVQLSQYGIRLMKKRQEVITLMGDIFMPLYKEISGVGGVTLIYRPSWKVESLEEAVTFLADRRGQDTVMMMTMAGVHRDRLEVVYREGSEVHSFVPLASTGQLRLAALLMRVSQAVVSTRSTGRRAVLLMDDVMLELDTDKRKVFTRMLPEYEQLFCTFLPDEPYSKYRRGSTMVYAIENGSWKSVQQ